MKSLHQSLESEVEILNKELKQRHAEQLEVEARLLETVNLIKLCIIIMFCPGTHILEAS